ncbi:hypothetical protein ASPWEDRAFT_27421 [Aspergillus wentii DTO 134E9]|uniref:Glucosamine 6-phosphate N-acetyltransferase n=1 Tax=Aspergillus wentii DTO 134E9 TaxID=1073089 RepID=A0A1L9RIM9_ASPWE|nr:uncharacterized protein ASPWEDRAFT_27421 [Aspergillus wentii DTO 134E9]KAI9932309.1 hypothetical protein MW887_009821 [Aspergillus wentii]OJJ34728.1 hypothetical protein ASPWEDRAFT_27421 [Aspergillus wentii DTO 134E9]
MTKHTFKTSLLPPPGPNQPLTVPTESTPIPANPEIFNDALTVRIKVFIDEQKCPIEAEIDTDDHRSWHWVIYDTTTTTAGSSDGTDNVNLNGEDKAQTHPTRLRSGLNDGDDETSPHRLRRPVAVIRLVPPPHAPHEKYTRPDLIASLPAYDLQSEPCVVLSRVAVLPEYRGYGLGRELIRTALDWARGHGVEIDDAYARVIGEAGEKTGKGKGKWNGQVLIHAQVAVEAMYRKFGFETDEALGRWDEEGIEHVGMWQRVDVIDQI